jgi:hypothetical protein
MNTSLEEIRTTVRPYLSDKSGLVGIPVDLLTMLDDANEAARGIAESMEGILALYAVNKISKETVKERFRALLSEPLRVHAATADSQNIVSFFEQYAPSTSPLGAVLIGASGNSYFPARPVGESNAFSQTPFIPKSAAVESAEEPERR